MVQIENFGSLFREPGLFGFQLFTLQTKCKSPTQVGDLINWAQVRFGVSMTLKAPPHAQGLGLVDLFHLINSPMA